MAQGDGREVEWLEDFVEVVRRIHNRIIEESGGVLGEHTALLYSAIARPFQTAFGENLYGSTVEQAAALFHAIICDHAFVDGNKRTATTLILFYLAAADHYISDEEPPSDLQVRMLGLIALETATGGLDAPEIAEWIQRIFAPSPRPLA